MTAATTHSTTTVFQTNPVYRLIGVILAFGALGLTAYGLREVALLDFAATVLSCTIVFTIGFWARRASSEKLQGRFGPFSRIAEAVIASQADVSAWVARRTLLAGVLVSALMGIGIALLRAGIVSGIHAMSSPWLAGGLGCAVGALAIAPEVFRWAKTAMAIKPAPAHTETEN
ncbi:hypothetical protein [Sinomonas halotolerans]|uniref:DUF3180 domain-containing protein n=1 Tax=Sinomonas halotolerans TaxID=1644133 RepID=A0ABU9WXN6_9MICC